MTHDSNSLLQAVSLFRQTVTDAMVQRPTGNLYDMDID